MNLEGIKELQTNSFSKHKLRRLISSWPIDSETEEEIEIGDKYQDKVVKCRKLALYLDDEGDKLPLFTIKMVKRDWQAINRFLKQFDYAQMVVTIYDSNSSKWFFSFVDLDFPKPRSYYYLLGEKKIDEYFQQAISNLIAKRKPKITDFRQTFSQNRLADQFFTQAIELVDNLKQELKEKEDSLQLARQVILQIITLKFLEEKGWLEQSIGDLYQKSTTEDKNLWANFLAPLLKNLVQLDRVVTCQLPNDILIEILNFLDNYNFSLAENTPEQQQVAITPQILSDLYEGLSSEDNRKQRGVFYTPPEIVYYMCQEGIVNYLTTEVAELNKEEIEELVTQGLVTNELKPYLSEIDDKLAQFKVCDPAVGSGAFAVGMLQAITQIRRNLQPWLDDRKDDYQIKLTVIRKSLYGVDLDLEATEVTRLRLWLSLVAEKETRDSIVAYSSLRYKFVTGNSLLEIEDNLFSSGRQEIKELKEDYVQASDAERKKLAAQLDEKLAQYTGEGFSFSFYFPEVFTEQSGFDLIIGNPPYVGEKGHKELFRKIKEYALGKHYIGKMDLFYFFFHLSLNLLKSQGHLVLITTNYYLRATRANKLRTDLKQRGTIKKLINFNELRLFSAAIGQHNLITVAMKGEIDIPAQTAVAYRKGMAQVKIVADILSGLDNKTNYYSVPQELLYEGENNYLRLETGELEKILTKVEQQGVQLGDLCNINQGIVTGCDRIYNRHLKQYDLDLQAGRGVFVLEEEEVDQLDFSQETNFFLKPWFKNSNIKKWLPEFKNDNYLFYLNHNLKNIPEEIKSYLTPAQAILKDRREVKRNLIDWWQLQWPREENIFTAPKIVAPQRSKSNIFAYTEENWYASADVYFITQSNRAIDLKYILALLNSNLYYLWLYRKGKKKGNLLELYQGPLTEIPIKLISPAKQKSFIKESERMMGRQEELSNLQEITWQGLLPVTTEQISLQELSSQINPIYQGRARKVRQIKAEIDNKKVIIFTAKAKKGWYQVLELKFETTCLAEYIKYNLENLSVTDLERINSTLDGWLVDKVKQIKLPKYSIEQINRLVKKWTILQQEINRLKEELNSGQEEINELVYNLYDLTAEEIKVTEKKREEMKD
ncbi:hypothetical protein JCM16358_04390 [Halanaerocella petrolearia]